MKWSLLADWVAKAVPPLVFVVVARLLTPADFGVVSAAMIVLAFSHLLWEAGLAKALVRWEGDIDRAASAAFWINVTIGIVVAAVLFLTAPFLADALFHDGRVAAVLRVMTLEILLGAVSAAHRGLLQRDLNFRQLFSSRLFGVAVPAVLWVVLAWLGFGYWSLVAGMLAGQLAQVIVLWRASKWRPAATFDRQIARELIRFGRWVGFTGFLAWVYAWADGFIVGHYFGTATMGLFRVGNQAATVAFAFLFAAAAPVLYSRFSSHGTDVERVRREVLKINGIVGAVSLPTALALIVFSHAIETAVFGPKWRGVGVVIALIAAKEGVLWIFAYNVEAYRAIGKPHLETAIAVLSAALNPIILIACAEYGFNVFLIGRGILLGLAGLVIHAAFALAVFGRAAVQPAYAKLALIFLLCAALFGLQQTATAHLPAGLVRYSVDALAVGLAFAASFAIQRTSIAELAAAIGRRELQS